MARLKIQLANKEIELERVKASKARTSRLSNNKIKTIYNVTSLDGSYNMIIEEIEKNDRPITLESDGKEK